MIDLPTVVSGAGVCLAGVMSPGPNFLAVSHRASTTERREALALVVGIAMVNMLWTFLALFGLGVVVAALPWLLSALKYAGAAYLLWLGVRLVRRAGKPGDASAAGPVNGGVQRALVDGVSTNLANPKSMVFYGSVFTGVVPQGASTPTLLALVTVVGMVAMAWYGALALALSGPGFAAWFRGKRPIVERVCGVILIMVAIRQVVAA